MHSCIKINNNLPYLYVDGNLCYPMAYTTYFEECGDFEGFIDKGYRMFFVNVSFTTLAINNANGFSPFLTGVFDGVTPDYSELDTTVQRILSKCSDALIFPRINIAMPSRWIEANESETVETPTGKRECMYSSAFRKDGETLLKELVSHIRSSFYSSNVAGYQLCGGTTQEWMHHDLSGSFSQKSLSLFEKWLKDKGEEYTPLKKSDLESRVFNKQVSLFGEFSCEMIAETVEHFAKALKKLINNEQVVGVFYGYNAAVNDYLWGLHGLRFILDSPYIDFFSSPCCYDENRALGFSWGDMISTYSLRLRNKLCIMECDIRTSLTKRMQASRPNTYSDSGYQLTDEKGNKTVWSGPDTIELSVSALRKAFAHQLTKGNGIWWFDMWGGWYKNEIFMSELQKMKDVADGSVNKNPSLYPSSEVVLFIDEKAYLNYEYANPFRHTVNAIRIAMGNTGIPFEICMVEDAHKVCDKFKVAILSTPILSDTGKKAAELFRSKGIPCIFSTKEKPNFTVDELRALLLQNGVHCYSNRGDVVYCGNGFLSVHSVKDGELTINLPSEYTVKQIFGDGFTQCKTNKIILNMQKHHTVIFELI